MTRDAALRILSEEQQKSLIDAAIQIRQRAYCPYSSFAVGAAILASDDSIFSGCNVENASYGASICAERAAAVSAIAAGRQHWSALAIAALPLATPCGICRQFLSEFGPQLQILLIDAQTRAVERTVLLQDLLPMAFDSSFRTGAAES